MFRWIISFLFPCFLLFAEENPLTPVRFDSPNETIKEFLKAMNEYRQGREKNDEKLLLQINKAIRALDTKDLNPILREEKAKEAAIFLKETIDRVYVPDYKTIPDFSEGSLLPIVKWTIPDTEITIVKIEEGARTGEFLFSSETVLRAGEFFQKVKHLPYLKNSGYGAGYELPWAERVLPKWTQKKFFNLEIWKWLGIVLAILGGIVLNLFSKLFFKLLLKLAKKTSTEWDEKIITNLYKPIGYFIVIGFWFVFLYSTGIEGKLFKFMEFVLKTLLGLVFVYFAYSFSSLLVDFLKFRASISKSPLDEQLIPLLSQSIKVILVIIGILVAIQNMGVNVMSLLAGLGIGGLAIALAAKDTAANLFGSAMIFMDKPFKVGDHILLSGIEGIVEAIGFRSTRIRTWEDSLVTIPNSVVANVSVENLGSRRYRRTNMVIGVTYDTSPEKMEAFLEAIKNILFASPLVVKDLINVGFREFGTSSLNVLLHFYLNVDTFAKNLEARQLIFLEVMRAAKSLDISFAFPTTTLHMETFPGHPPTRVPKEFSEEVYKQKAKDFSKDSKTSKIQGAGIYTPAYKDLEKDQNSTVI